MEIAMTRWLYPAAFATCLLLVRQSSAEDPAKSIRKMLDDQVAAWNKGDLKGFMQGYWDSTELTFYSGLVGEFTGPLEASYASHAHALTGLGHRAKAMLAEPGTGIEELRTLNLEMTSRISAILHDVNDAGILARLERTVVLASAEIAAFERSWYAPLKLERFPDQVRPLGSFIPVQQSVS